MKRKSKIFIAGHNGLVGSAIIRYLKSNDNYLDIIIRNRSELDLTNQNAVDLFFKSERPEYIILAAAKVGGIIANSTYQGDFIRDNLLIQTNVIDAAKRYGCKKFCFLGSSCIYPKFAPQPLKEEYLLTGQLESSNIAYAVAKIAGVQMIRAYREQFNFPGYSLMPTNMYGYNDNFDLKISHVLPALIRKFHEAKINNDENVVIWGANGVARREFMFVDDFAEIIIKTLYIDNIPDLMNIGSGVDMSINELAILIKDVIKYEGNIIYDASKPDGTPQKLLDVSKMNSYNLYTKTDLRTGIDLTYKWFSKT